ncbi:MAG: hypothetical protein AAF791_09950 [Bacteroidota bacterium]
MLIVLYLDGSTHTLHGVHPRHHAARIAREERHPAVLRCLPYA